jgi:poly(hydroxyalkanoate) granule-associated protein
MMTDNVNDVNENAQNPENDAGKRHSYFHTARKLLLASIGAISLAQDEIEDFINRLIQRGEIAEADGRKLMEEIRDRRKDHMGKAEDLVTKRLESMLKHLNTPTKAEVESLSEKIAALSKKLDEIIVQQGK